MEIPDIGSFFTVSVESPTILFQGSFVEAPFYSWSEYQDLAKLNQDTVTFGPSSSDSRATLIPKEGSGGSHSSSTGTQGQEAPSGRGRLLGHTHLLEA